MSRRRPTPRLKLHTKRIVYLGLKLSDPEHDELRALSAGLGVSKSEFARHAVEVYGRLALAVMKAETRPPTAERLRSILIRVAAGLNQRASNGTLHRHEGAEP